MIRRQRSKEEAEFTGSGHRRLGWLLWKVATCPGCHLRGRRKGRTEGWFWWDAGGRVGGGAPEGGGGQTPEGGVEKKMAGGAGSRPPGAERKVVGRGWLAATARGDEGAALACGGRARRRWWGGAGSWLPGVERMAAR